MDLLIISSEQAKEIEALWGNSWMPLTMMVVSLVALVFFGFGLLATISVCMHLRKESMFLLFTVPVLLVGVGLGTMSVHNARAVTTNMDASENVIDYHKMKHLRTIYPKLPCKPQITYKTCNSNSLSKVSKNKRIARHVLTRHKAVKKYNHYHSMYRSLSGNGTKSIHPYVPHWYNCL